MTAVARARTAARPSCSPTSTRRSPPRAACSTSSSRQGAAIRERDVDGRARPARRDPDRDGPPRARSSRTAPRCSQRAGAALGVPATQVTLERLCDAHARPRRRRARPRALGRAARPARRDRPRARHQPRADAPGARLPLPPHAPDRPASPSAGYRPTAPARPPPLRRPAAPPRPRPPGLAMADLLLLRPPDVAARPARPAALARHHRPQHRQRLHARATRARRRVLARRRPLQIPAGGREAAPARSSAPASTSRPTGASATASSTSSTAPRTRSSASRSTRSAGARPAPSWRSHEPGDNGISDPALASSGTPGPTSPTPPDDPAARQALVEQAQHARRRASQRVDAQLADGRAAQAQRRVRRRSPAPGGEVAQIATEIASLNDDDQAARDRAATRRTT